MQTMPVSLGHQIGHSNRDSLHEGVLMSTPDQPRTGPFRLGKT